MIGGHLYPDTMTIKSQTWSSGAFARPQQADGDAQDDVTLRCAFQVLSDAEAVEQGQEQGTKLANVFCPDQNGGAAVSIAIDAEVEVTTSDGADQGRWQVSEAPIREVSHGGFYRLVLKRKDIYP